MKDHPGNEHEATSDSGAEAEFSAHPEILDFAAVSDEGFPRPRSLPCAQVTFEGVMGLLAAFFIGLPSPFLAAVGAAHLPVKIQWFWLVVPTLLLTGYLSVLVVRLAGRAIEGDHDRISFGLASSLTRPPGISTYAEPVYLPLAVAMAIRLPKWPPVVRPFVAAWWLCHFLAAAFIGHAVAAHWLRGVNNQGLFVVAPMTLLFTFAFLFAANLYLLLAVAVCIRRPGVWLTAWRNRFVVDVVIAAIVLATGR